MRNSWPFHFCHFECLSDSFRNYRWSCYRCIPFCQWPECPYNINELEIFLVEPVQAPLPGDCHDRHVAKICVCKPCRQVHCPWPQGRKADSCLPSQPSVSRCHESSALLMSCGNKLYF